jgi:small multidrug resistance pump
MKLWILINSWLSLAVAIIFGVMGTMSLKLSYGFKNKSHVYWLILFYVISFIALTFAMKYIQLSVVYAIWSGVGTILVSIIGMLYFKESVSLSKLFFLLLIVFGVIGIHFSNTFT